MVTVSQEFMVRHRFRGRIAHNFERAAKIFRNDFAALLLQVCTAHVGKIRAGMKTKLAHALVD